MLLFLSLSLFFFHYYYHYHCKYTHTHTCVHICIYIYMWPVCILVRFQLNMFQFGDIHTPGLNALYPDQAPWTTLRFVEFLFIVFWVVLFSWIQFHFSQQLVTPMLGFPGLNDLLTKEQLNQGKKSPQSCYMLSIFLRTRCK